MMDKKNQQGLILSALTENGINTFEDFQSWFEKIKTNEKFKVKKTKLKDLASWSYDENRSSFKHESGKFFGITGILVSHKYEEREEKVPTFRQVTFSLLLLNRNISSTRKNISFHDFNSLVCARMRERTRPDTPGGG